MSKFFSAIHATLYFGLMVSTAIDVTPINTANDLVSKILVCGLLLVGGLEFIKKMVEPKS